MYVQRLSLSATTDASGDATVYTENITGRIQSIRYVKDGTSPYDNTVDFTFTAESTGIAVLTVANVTASTTYHPVAAAAKTADGAASTLTEVGVCLANERLKLVVAQGGNAKTGSFWIVVV